MKRVRAGFQSQLIGHAAVEADGCIRIVGNAHFVDDIGGGSDKVLSGFRLPRTSINAVNLVAEENAWSAVDGAAGKLHPVRPIPDLRNSRHRF